MWFVAMNYSRCEFASCSHVANIKENFFLRVLIRHCTSFTRWRKRFSRFIVILPFFNDFFFLGNGRKFPAGDTVVSQIRRLQSVNNAPNSICSLLVPSIRNRPHNISARARYDLFGYGHQRAGLRGDVFNRYVSGKMKQLSLVSFQT